jgi:hypothetical protein
MLRSALLAAMVLSTLSEGAAQRVTVDELRQILTQQRAAHLSDDQMVSQLGSLELTERLSEATLDQIEAEFNPGVRTIAQISVLADLSAFLEPPSHEVLDKAPPSAMEQQQMLVAVENFATVTLKHLPDFLATRTTRNLEDVPILTGDLSAQSEMHPIGSSVREVAYRNGLEFASTGLGAAKQGLVDAPSPGLSSSGEFGPVLATIMSDSAAGEITWSHWEQTSAGPSAVFRFAVPKESAHYMIDFCCSRDPETGAMDSYRGEPAYRGSITVNASTGSVIRLTLEADLESLDPTEHFSLVVRYGNVEIGGRNLICPLASAVVFRTVILARRKTWNVIHLNQVSFSNYRRFGSTAQIVPDAPDR